MSPGGSSPVFDKRPAARLVSPTITGESTLLGFAEAYVETQLEEG